MGEASAVIGAPSASSAPELHPAALHWARRPAGIARWCVGAMSLAGSLWIGLPILRFVHKLWTVITWNGPGAPPGPYTICFFMFPFVLIAAAAVLTSGVCMFIGMGRAAAAIRRGTKPQLLLLLALGLLALPLLTVVSRSIFVIDGDVRWPSATHLFDLITPHALLVGLPVLLLLLAMTLLCCIRDRAAAA